MLLSKSVPLSRLIGLLTCNIHAKWIRLVCLVSFFAIALSSLPVHLKHDSATAQGSRPQRTQGPPSRNLPNLDEARGIEPGTPKIMPPVPATKCRGRDEKCKKAKGKISNNLPDNQDRLPTNAGHRSGRDYADWLNSGIPALSMLAHLVYWPAHMISDFPDMPYRDGGSVLTASAAKSANPLNKTHGGASKGPRKEYGYRGWRSPVAALSGNDAAFVKPSPSVGLSRSAATSGARKTADVLWYTLPEGNASVQLSTGFSFGIQSNWITGWGVPDWLGVGDFNGDGKDDLIWYEGWHNAGASVVFSTGSGFTSRGQWFTGFSMPDWAAVGDFNGDGKADVLWYETWNNAGVNVLLSRGDGFNLGGQWLTGLARPIWASVGDFNGDGLDDLIWYLSNGAASVYFSTGNGFAAQGAWLVGWGAPDFAAVGDFNGDGKDDLLWYEGWNNAGGTIAFSTGTGFNAQGQWFTGFGRPDWAAVADVNGDGKADLLWYENWNNAGINVLLSRANGFDFGGQWAIGFPIPTRAAVGNFDGDSKFNGSGCGANVSADRWRGEYYTNTTLTGSVAMVRDDGAGFLNMNFGAGSLSESCGVGADNFSARWTRTVNFAQNVYRFSVTGDDGVRLYVDGQLRIDKWIIQQAPTTYTADVFLSAGNHEVKLEYYENSGGAVAHLSWTSVGGATCLANVPADRWRGEYYNNTNLTGSPAMVRDDGAGFLNFDFGTGSPSSACGVSADNFSARWTRTVNFAQDIYRFSVNVDDGARLYVDGQLVIDRWIIQPGIYTADVPLSAGDHEIKLEYFEAGGYAKAVLSWTSLSGTAGDLNMALIDPINRIGSPGKDLLSRNCNWSLPLLALPGRAGLDLGLALSLNSLVYTRAGSVMYFDPTQGYPAPGFSMGFPEIRNAFINTDAGAQSYLLSMPSGSRVEFRQISTNVYEAVDSSYVLLTHDPVNSVFVLYTTDGTQCRFVDVTGSGDYKCVQIKDRNGNYITIGYGSLAEIRTVTDTLSRVINFNYDGFNHLLSITQSWGGQTHTWATFAYGTQTIQTNFPGLTLNGTANGAQESVLTRVGLADGSVYSFEYNTYAQVKTIRRYAPNNSNPVNFPGDYFQRAYTTYGLPDTATNPQMDCPRATSRTDWAHDWNSGVTVAYAADLSHSWGQVTFQDGTIYKEFFATTGWQRGLTTQTENWSGGVKKKLTTLEWTQDNTGISYQLNPRVTETNVYDEEGNRRRTTMSYTSFGLPSDVYAYDTNATTVLRRTHTDYNLSAVYTGRRIIGLPSAQYLYDGNNTLFSKVTNEYDLNPNPNPYLQHPGPTAQHDTANYGSGFVQGRGNLNRKLRWDVTDPNIESKASEYETGYNTSGSVIFTRDPLDHQTSISYADSFSDGQNNRNTYAYPTTMTDPDTFSSAVQYNYDFGAVTRTQDPKGAAVTRNYDAAGRVERARNEVNGAYTRYVYAPNQSYVQSFTTINDLNQANEFYSIMVFDGHDRVRGTASDHPTSVGQYKAQYNLYDMMGRLAQQTNPTEIDNSWQPAGDDAAGWVWSYQSYDWQGRSTVYTNQDGTTKEILYGGCGCAGGQVVVTRDEVGRRQKMTYDILGRLKMTQALFAQLKSEPLNGDGDVYSTTTNTYNVRDQITNVTVTDNGAGVSQNTVMTYDGHGRMQSRKLPIESAATTYDYKGDDTLNWVIDARGAKSQFSYNNRRQVTGVTYSDTGGSGLIATPGVSFQYDELGNRTLMDDGPGFVSYGYNSLGQLTSETRTFDMPGAPAGQFTTSYQYGLAGQLTRITDPFGAQIDYTYDKSIRLTRVTGTDFAGITTYIDNVTYRAWGSAKSITYGIYNGTQVAQMTYNARMLPAHYELAGQASVDYGYSFDGRLNQVIGLSDSKLHQSFIYDHQGRLKFAKADGGGVAPTQYDLSYTYDAFGDPVHRGISHWFASSYGVAATYENDRMITANEAGTQQRFFYDQSGNKLNSEKQNPLNGEWSLAAVFRYDMRGQVVGLGPVSPTNPDQTRFYDGDGALVTITGVSVLTYYLRSSVLGGQILTTILSSGQKLTTEVFAGKEIIATQCVGCVVFGVNLVNFHRRDPQRTLDLYNGYVYMMDPLGIRVQPATQEQINGGGGQNPPPVNPGNYYSASTIDAFGTTNNAMTCRHDGIPVPCDRLLREAANGGLERITVSTTGGMGGVGGGTGAIMGAFWLASGQAESTMSVRLRRIDGKKLGLKIGNEVTTWEEPPQIEVVFANNVNFFFGQGGGQQGGATFGKLTPNIGFWNTGFGDLRKKFDAGFKAIQTNPCKDYINNIIKKSQHKLNANFEDLLKTQTFHLYNPDEDVAIRAGTWSSAGGGGAGYKQLQADAQSIGRTVGEAQAGLNGVWGNTALTIGNNTYLNKYHFQSYKVNAAVLIVHEILHAAGIRTRPGYWVIGTPGGEPPDPFWVSDYDPIVGLEDEIKKHCAP